MRMAGSYADTSPRMSPEGITTLVIVDSIVAVGIAVAGFGMGGLASEAEGGASQPDNRPASRDHSTQGTDLAGTYLGAIFRPFLFSPLFPCPDHPISAQPISFGRKGPSFCWPCNPLLH